MGLSDQLVKTIRRWQRSTSRGNYQSLRAYATKSPVLSECFFSQVSEVGVSHIGGGGQKSKACNSRPSGLAAFLYVQVSHFFAYPGALSVHDGTVIYKSGHDDPHTRPIVCIVVVRQ